MKENNQSLKESLEYIQIIIRYIASGFIAFAIYIFLFDNDFRCDDKSWFYLFLTAAIGIITYSFHFAWLDTGLYIRATTKALNRHEPASDPQKPSPMSKSLLDRIRNSQTIKARRLEKKKNHFDLATQTYLRHISDDPQLKELQSQMEKRLAILHFIYCSCYQATVLVVYYLIYNWIIHRHLEAHELLKVVAIGVGIIVGFLFAKEFDFRICLRELWVIDNFPQNIKVPSVPATGTPSSPGLENKGVQKLKYSLVQTQGILTQMKDKIEDAINDIGC